MSNNRPTDEILQHYALHRHFSDKQAMAAELLAARRVIECLDMAYTWDWDRTGELAESIHMKLAEMKRIAKKRTKWISEQSAEVMSDSRDIPLEDADFLKMADDSWDKLMAVVEAAQGVIRREEIGGYGHEGIPALRETLKALEDET